ncbi:hypothetical protein Mal15_19490 [Stieleria maiorica]|uniref:Uncharacterized protein n=1 Tax=Stieleria maiorica TaxID=2795974 RepID=A0A5B9MB05_9BACT|nr:hypothetical protein [Stieleria maiorica]QEF97903.1 hypothetical protein Mal15_19490 [Stieleria maiorica]
MNIAELARPEVSDPIDPKDEIRFLFGANPFANKMCQLQKDPAYLGYYMNHWHRPPPLPGPGDVGDSVLGIPWLWYWLAIGCEGCASEPDHFVLPVVIALWHRAIRTGRREVPLKKEFLEEFELKPRSADRALKRLHEKSLILYIVHNTKQNNVLLLPTPRLDDE